MLKSRRTPHKNQALKKVRYAVVGLGHIAQSAVLPAFEHARKNSELTALVSDDPVKLKKLGRKYEVENLYSYDDYDKCLKSGVIDAVYIALPNHLHAEYSIRAADAGIHVLCEKPMATTEQECIAMIRAVEKSNVRLMIAYRLHFEEANLKAMELMESGKIGEPRIFNSVFSMQVRPANIRTEADMGGGPLFDIGIYCINAARYLFGEDPQEVFAISAGGHDERFTEVEEGVSALMRFPGERLAQFSCSFGAADASYYQVVGTKGDLCVDPAYEHTEDLQHHLTISGKTRVKTFKKRDQFAPELIYFSNCVHSGAEPEPSGNEGLIDVRIMNALYESAKAKKSVLLNRMPPDQEPESSQELKKPPVSEPELVHAAPPSEG